MSDFSDRPFAAGSLIGLRTFWVENDGSLRGPQYPAPFHQGVNEASCYDTWPVLGALLHSMTALFGDGLSRFDLPPSRRSQLAHHQLAGLHCSCGFYAFTDTGANRYRGTCTVGALIEGFGVCTVGDRGFRASKARLVALVDPAPYVFHRARNSRSARLFPAVRARYDVPVYKSERAAIKAHPLGPKGGV